MGLAGLPVEGPTRTTASYKMTPFTPRAPRRGSRLFNLFFDLFDHFELVPNHT